MIIPDELNERTYAIQHSPNCPKPFLVRLVGRTASRLDYQSPLNTKDILGYGMTCEEAARNAFTARKAQDSLPFETVIAADHRPNDYLINTGHPNWAADIGD